MLKILPAKNNFNRLFLITLSTKTDKVQKTKQNKKHTGHTTYRDRTFPSLFFLFSNFCRIPFFCTDVSFIPFWPNGKS